MWSSVVALSLQYLCHHQPLLSKVSNTWKKVLENKRKDHSALGEPSVSQGTKPTVGCRGFCLLPAHQRSFKEKIYTHMCFSQPPPGPEIISKSGFKQRPSDRTRLSHFKGSWEEDIIPGHTSPLRGRDWVNPLWLSEVTPLIYQQVEISSLREKP